MFAQSAARRFYQQLIAEAYTHAKHKQRTPSVSDALDVTSNATIKPVAAKYTFAAVAARMLSNEHARVERGEYSSGSLRVLQNRMDAHILPRWAMHSPADIDYFSAAALYTIPKRHVEQYHSEPILDCGTQGVANGCASWCDETTTRVSQSQNCHNATWCIYTHRVLANTAKWHAD